MPKQVLIVVDVQRDFCPGGALAVTDGDKVIPPLNRVIAHFERARLPVYYTRDWHPSDHISFKEQGGIWPPHCMKNTWGAAFHSNLKLSRRRKIISKGTRPEAEAYSGFQGTDLEHDLKLHDVDVLVVGGLATDYCVKNTVLDGLRAGFDVLVLKDCIRGVNLRRSDSAEALREMKAGGAIISSSPEVPNLLKRVTVLSSS